MATTIKINKKRAIIVYPHMFALATWSIRKNPETKEPEHFWKEEAWYTVLYNAINALAQEFVADKELTLSLKEFIEEYKKAQSEITKMLEHEGV